MTKKIFIAATFLFILAALVSCCGQATSPSSTSLPVATESPITLPISQQAPSIPAAGIPKPVSPSTPSISIVPPLTPANSDSMVQTGLMLKVTQPIDGSTLNTGAVTVQGQTASGATVTIGDQIGTADVKGNFSIPLTLGEGPNFLDITALDNNGNRGEIILMVNVDLSQALSAPGTSESPSGTIPLEVTSPADGATLNTANIVVKGKTAAGAVVSVNDQVEIADEQGNFSITINLENGINVIDVTASDDNGNQIEVILMVNVM